MGNNGVALTFLVHNDINYDRAYEFGEQVPSQLDFSVGYYDGSQQAKTWLVTRDDLDAMYKKYPNGGSVSLWCDGRATEVASKRKRDLDSQAGCSYR